MKDFREKLVRIPLRDITEEEGKEEILNIIKDKGYTPIDIVWRKKELLYSPYDDLECYFNIEQNTEKESVENE